ncbi:ribonuclease Z [Psychroflexus sp. CAK57W]|uniref:ribonuclease Z n=1 Tax=Psychroflexus curvus TaxID=2873595 RepID=UPI001CCE862D|nr:ribonuclease Z [Psychroflexus curvus]MBZ9627699.1 ribonuclease Z [Psychroflexus curvus]MBZ9786186.1 ribonuclease Z [Psychroflexus curvus]
MKTEQKDNYIILSDEKDDVEDFADFLTRIQNRFKDQNVVIDIQKYGNLTLEELLKFLKLSFTHRKGKKSLVVVNDTINIDAVPDEIHVVPTFQEAEDLIGLEEIERDLGF